MTTVQAIGGIDFDVSPRVERGAGWGAPERKPDDPLYRPMRIFALDPSRGRGVGGSSLVNVPFERISGNGPVGHLFDVRDDGLPGETLHRDRLDVNHPVFLLEDGRAPSPSDPLFRAQMAYAVCSLTYDAFRRALGREIPWGFDRVEADGSPARLIVRPAVDGERNAYYDPGRGELRFGVFKADKSVEGRNLPGGRVATALIHDVVVHETSHALLDGLRSKFMSPTGPDVAAFHEAFADLVAIFLKFTYRDLVRDAIVETRGDFRRSSVMSDFGVQFAQTAGQGSRLRDAARRPEPDRRYSPDEHIRGEVLVAAAYRAFATVFARKAAPILRLSTGGSEVFAGRLPDGVADALTDIACRLGRHFLNICIRAIDYCPPVDIQFGEFLRAVVTADSNLVTDDPWRYREAWIDAFREYGIDPPEVSSLSEEALLWDGPDVDRQVTIPELSFSNLEFDGDPGHPAGREELRRQAGALGAFVTRSENLATFGLALPSDPQLNGDTVDRPTVQSIRTSRRLGPDGQILFDLVAEVTQRRTVRPRQGTPLFQFLGGSTVIIDPKGTVRYLIRKSVLNEERLVKQADFIMANAAGNEHGSALWLSTSDGELIERPQRFRLMHARRWSAESPRELTSTSKSYRPDMELEFNGVVKKGMRGRDVKVVQEWLTLHKFGLAIDGDFGNATEAAVSAFQTQRELAVTGAVDEATFDALVEPLANALKGARRTGNLVADVTANVEHHLEQHPREVGGQNSGPWVRVYMEGREGPTWPWCAGFACFVIRQAADGAALPIKSSYSCDELGRDAARRGVLLIGGPEFDTSTLRPGALFLVRRPGQGGWHHTGIVIATAPGSVTTVEGNTNDVGSREGIEVCRRVRSTASLDFIAVT